MSKLPIHYVQTPHPLHVETPHPLRSTPPTIFRLPTHFMFKLPIPYVQIPHTPFSDSSLTSCSNLHTLPLPAVPPQVQTPHPLCSNSRPLCLISPSLMFKLPTHLMFKVSTPYVQTPHPPHVQSLPSLHPLPQTDSVALHRAGNSNALRNRFSASLPVNELMLESGRARPVNKKAWGTRHVL